MPAETGNLYSFGAVGDGPAAHVRGSRARSGAWGVGVPAQRPRGFGAQPRLVEEDWQSHDEG